MREIKRTNGQMWTYGQMDKWQMDKWISSEVKVEERKRKRKNKSFFDELILLSG